MENQELTVADLAFVKNLIDIVSKRGAFNADELTVVGTFYDKLSAFLSNVQSQSAEATEGAEPAAQAPVEQGE